MIEDIIPIDCLIVMALFEANKLGLGTTKQPIDNIDILKFIELFKGYYLQKYGSSYKIDYEIIGFFEKPLNFSSNSRLEEEYKNNSYLKKQTFINIFTSLKQDYIEYLKGRYLMKKIVLKEVNNASI